ncbi:MAG: T9SS type A sorting domain-containing protein [Candidatus Kapabacteria bacterium]|jgi:hypothetical protein|nr:T9SS type A sorting domain-containing protein [Candidatus Kapabacteria bacterium]
MSGSEKQVMLRVVITDAAGRRVTAEKFITCRDCTPAAMRLAARSVSPFGSTEAGFTSTSALFSSGFTCGTQVNSSLANNRPKGTSTAQDSWSATPMNMVHNESDEAIPSVTRLEQNTPNPFENETTIHFGLSKPSTVSLTIYDVFGREIVKVIEHQRFNAGNHSFVVVMNSLPSGTYSYRLATDKGAYTRQMMLVH